MPQHISRRDFLALAGMAGVAGAIGLSRPTAAAVPRTASAIGDVSSRVLVVVELAGGNDGLSMAPPADAERLAQWRPNTFPALDTLLPADGDVVLHPALTRLQHRPITVVDGLGTPAPDGSHFEMLRRWWAGDADGTAGQATGFLGRLCDALDAGAPVTGLSVGGGSTPALVAERAGTLGLPDPGWLWWLGPDDDVGDWVVGFRQGLGAMAEPDPSDGPTLTLARRGIAGALPVGAMVASLGEGPEYPGTGVASKLAIAAQVIAADVGVRVVHVLMDSDFDTHEGHLDRHAGLMAELDEALDAFLADVDGRGLASRVLVATTSEFGRRPEENGSGGLDHGTASTALLLGPVAAARVGEPADLDIVDDDGNFVAPTSMDRYYATLAERWFEIPAADVLPGRPEPLPVGW
jgi:uncharacterized protein (DUF1501 family)